MKNLEKLIESDRAHFCHPSTHAHDHEAGKVKTRVINGASGIRIQDAEGNELIDAFAGLYCVNIGYGREEVAEAMYEQAKKLAYYHTYVGHSSEVIIELSERIIDWAPAGMKKVYYGMSGSDANETQLKLVRYYHNIIGKKEKKKVISRDRGYHGSGLYTGSLTGLPVFHQAFDLPEPSIKHTICPHWYRKAPEGMNEEDFSKYCAQKLEEMILEEGADTIGAFIAEPVLGTGGIVPPPKGYWQAIQPVLKKYDILLIADEVVCGFGRIGSKMGSQYYDIKPDLITVAKGLTSAYAPLSGVIIGEKVWDVISQGSVEHGAMGHGWTYSGHPVCAAAGLANLRILQEENIMQNVQVVGDYLQQQLRQTFSDHPLVGEARGVGMLGALEFMQDKQQRIAFDGALSVGAKVSAACLERGMIARAMPHGDILGFAPPLVATQQDIDSIIAIAKEAVDSVAEQVI